MTQLAGNPRRDMSVEEFREYAKVLNDYDHPLPKLMEALPSVVEVVDAYLNECDTTGPDPAWEYEAKTLVRLADGRYGLLFEWTDYSGHG